MEWLKIGAQIWILLLVFFCVPGLIAYARGASTKQQFKYALANFSAYLGSCAVFVGLTFGLTPIIGGSLAAIVAIVIFFQFALFSFSRDLQNADKSKS